MKPDFPSTQLRGVANLALVAPIKQGFVTGYETITYVERLRRLLSALNSARVAAREASMASAAFPDPVGRFDIIHSFRYAIAPPRSDAARDPQDVLLHPGVSQLTLNVTFDGGFEPYMRVIYRDIGSLLDALFCHCVGYPVARTSSFDTYCRWVREHELEGGLFYADSAMGIGDQKYLDRMERIQREERDPQAADRKIAQLALEPMAVQEKKALQQAMSSPQSMLTAANQGFRMLKGLHRLSPYFPPNEGKDSDILLRFAHDVLRGFRGLIDQKVFEPGKPLAQLGENFSAELAWLGKKPAIAKRKDRLQLDEAKLQAGILTSDTSMTHGCLAMLRIDKPDQAAQFLATWATPRKNKVQRNIAFTYAGLRALGFSRERLDALPQEFIEGMEARAGLLGDLRSNHPDNWARPEGPAPGKRRVDLSTVHVVLTLRLADSGRQSAGLHPQLERELKAFPAAGLTVLAVQAMRSYAQGGHFAFADGLSQPAPVMKPKVPKGAVHSDEVAAGELLLGYRNGRGDDPFPAQADGLLDDGSFLVVRKLRQHMDVLDDVLKKAVAASKGTATVFTKDMLLEKMMGRRKNGTTLMADKNSKPNDNNFNYAKDPEGAQCPFHSHARRSNPRDDRPYTPRILRRGMSYGALSTKATIAEDRGVVFMAYCASIAEQFEVLQRWIAGGNSSGVSSRQADPFLGVPEPDDSARTLRFQNDDGSVARIDLGADPIVSLQWGLYLFAPSLTALQNLPALVGATHQPRTAPASVDAATPPAAIDAWRSVLEDPEQARRAAGWQQVRAQAGGVLPTPYGLLVGKSGHVQEVLQDSGKRFSVCGYGERLSASVGQGYLGLDPHNGHDEQAPEVNAAIEKISAQQAFMLARPIAEAVIARFKGLALPETGVPLKLPVDILTLSEAVLGALCARWFGLPDGKLMVPGGRNIDAPATPARCPGHLFSVSRYVFSSRPQDAVVKDGKEHGQAVLEAFKQLLKGGQPLTSMVQDMKTAIQKLPAVHAGDPEHLVARTVAGVMMGFPPTVHGNFVNTVDAWLKTRRLWELQQALGEAVAALPDPYERARAVLFQPLMDTMRGRPVPETIWRTAVGGARLEGQSPVDAEQRVVLGLASAVSDPAASHYLMFGGARNAADGPKTVHACPGYGMAIGVLLALLSALLEAGTIRPTGSSILLTLILPPAPVNPPAPAAPATP